MENLEFDRGVRCFQINGGGVLRFNPADPNLFDRFLQAREKIAGMEIPSTEDPWEAMKQADGQLKQLLGWVFGAENDFDAILGGVNLLAAASNGQSVLENLLQALEPVLSQGVEQCVRLHTAQAKAAAQARREGQ